MVRSEILGLFVKVSTADDKYFCYKRERFLPAIQIQLSQKPKIFYQSFIAYLESLSNFRNVDKKDEDHSSTISDIFDFERSCYLNVLKAMF